MTEFDCLHCGHRLQIDITETESRTILHTHRTDFCPKCFEPVGTGPVACRRCGTTFVVEFPHQHVHCDLATGVCPACGEMHQSPCIC